MPCYIFANPDDPEDIVEIFQGINDEHKYICDGVAWGRVFTVPYAFVKDAPIDPDSSTDFLKKTDGKKDTFGGIWDRSKELSEKRKERYGHDPVEKKHEEDWSKSRGGRKLNKKMKDLKVEVKL